VPTLESLSLREAEPEPDAGAANVTLDLGRLRLGGKPRVGGRRWRECEAGIESRGVMGMLQVPEPEPLLDDAGLFPRA